MRIAWQLWVGPAHFATHDVAGANPCRRPSTNHSRKHSSKRRNVVALSRVRLRRKINRLGVDIVRYPIHTTLPGHLKSLLRQLEAGVVVDVGANVGQFGLMLRNEVGFDGRIVSFEPDPSSFTKLMEVAAEDENWTAFNFACGSDNSNARLLQFDGSDWNSLHEIDQDALVGSGRTVTQIGSVDCQVRRLDDMWSECVAKTDEIVYLKSDTQGHDSAVLDGVGSHYDQVAGLLLEASIRTFYADEPHLLDADRRGYSPSGFFPVTRTKSSPALDTLDVSFVRKV